MRNDATAAKAIHRPWFLCPKAAALRFAVLALAACATAGAAGSLRSERAIVRLVDAEADAATTLLERLVNQNSGTFNRAGVQEVGKLLEAQFQALGFRTRWVSMDGLGRAPHLVAEHEGGHGKRLLLIGHMDTVFEPFSPFRQFVRRGDQGAGPGAVDDKGGLVVMITALRALKAAAALEAAAITVFITADEEHPGTPVSAARAEFIAAAKRADAALCFEAGVRIDGQDFVSTARRGAASWTVKATGNAAHSGGIFSVKVGDGAIFELSRILSRFHDELREPDLTFSVGLVLGGANIKLDPAGAGSVAGKVNIVPPEAEALGDIRALRPAQLESVKEHMRAIVAAHLPGTAAQIEFDDDGYPPMAPSPGNEALLGRYNEVSRGLGFGEVRALNPMLRGAGDSAFIAPYVDTISGLGLVGEGTHTSGEVADLRSLPVQAKRAAVLIYRLTSEPRHR